MFFSVFSLVLALLVDRVLTVIGADCRYHDKDFTYGAVWADVHACGWCECNQYGAQCAPRSGQCALQNITVKPLDPLCKYNMNVHMVGDVYKTLDGCNTCLCTERGMQCTAHPCKSTGFDTYSSKTLYGECFYENKWYLLHSHWLAKDGCNTCYCYGVGNYRGPHECTSSPCNCSRQSPVITG